MLCSARADCHRICRSRRLSFFELRLTLAPGLTAAAAAAAHTAAGGGSGGTAGSARGACSPAAATAAHGRATAANRHAAVGHAGSGTAQLRRNAGRAAAAATAAASGVAASAWLWARCCFMLCYLQMSLPGWLDTPMLWSAMLSLELHMDAQGMQSIHKRICPICRPAHAAGHGAAWLRAAPAAGDAATGNAATGHAATWDAAGGSAAARVATLPAAAVARLIRAGRAPWPRRAARPSAAHVATAAAGARPPQAA